MNILFTVVAVLFVIVVIAIYLAHKMKILDPIFDSLLKMVPPNSIESTVPLSFPSKKEEYSCNSEKAEDSAGEATNEGAIAAIKISEENSKTIDK